VWRWAEGAVEILILGANGFIGNSLVRAILDRNDWRVTGLDRSRDKLEHSLGHPRFRFVEGDLVACREWVDGQIERSDVILPLVAIATPMAYVKQPLDVFALTFEENLRIVKRCAAAGKRLIFPSSSEVYGMCDAEPFDEETSSLVLGPIHKERWIYACSKQLLDRVIWALGRHAGLDFTLVRPFNWIGPRLDDPRSAREGSSRVVTQFIDNLVNGEPIRLVDGGRQRRCFTYIDDGIDCLMRILEDPCHRARGRIFNIGHPGNDCSMRDLAHRLRELFRPHARRRGDVALSTIVEVSAEAHYGDGYQDILVRTPEIRTAREALGWTPRVGLDEALRRTLDAYVAALAPAGR
jgi:nucleoside-diphosphate-sugar epimerase